MQSHSTWLSNKQETNKTAEAEAPVFTSRTGRVWVTGDTGGHGTGGQAPLTLLRPGGTGMTRWRAQQ